jgi:hypothetical protein
MRLLHTARLLLLALPVAAIPAPILAQIAVSVGFAPPALPVYEQPICPEPNLMWTPGVWNYGPEGYFWVPGTWVPAPYVGALWTPPYWGWQGGNYLFNDGYWGAQVGFYGGVNYGFGYMGIGFAGGMWQGSVFSYNTAIMRVNTTIIRNTYVNETIVRNNTIANANHVAYNGGPGGIRHEATAEERTAAGGRHVAPTPVQVQHVAAARTDKSAYAKANGGHPHTLAAARPSAATRTAAARTEAHTPAARTETHAPAAHAETHAKTESHTATHPATHATSEPHTASRSETHAPAAHTETHAKTESHAATHPAPATHAEPKPAPETRAESHPAPAVRPESHPAARPEPRSEPKPEPKAEPKSEPKAEPKSEPKHEQR